MPSALFRACGRWRSYRPGIANHDCSDCTEQYLEVACPVFRKRFVIMLGADYQLTPEQVEQGIAALRKEM